MRAKFWLLGLLLFAVLASSVSAVPQLTYPRVTPTSGDAGTTFTFTIHYAGEEPIMVELYLGGQPYQMSEVDPTDDNATDGKDYFFEGQLPEGTTIFYFKATVMPGTEVRTTAATINVAGSDLSFSHLDVVFAVLIFLIPVAWALVMFRRFSRDMREILDELKNRKSE